MFQVMFYFYCCTQNCARYRLPGPDDGGIWPRRCALSFVTG
jgi:hypothetical protein